MRVFALFPLLAACAAPLHAQSLPDLLQAAHEAALHSRLAQAEIEEAAARLALVQARGGMRAFASGGWGRNREEPINSDPFSYHAVTARIGLSVPLLGSAEKSRQEENEAQLAVKQAESRRLAAIREAQRLLLQANAALFAAERRMALTHAFLRQEAPARSFLHKRSAQHLLLRSDHLDFLAMFDVARRELEKDRQAQRAALDVLRRLSGRDLPDYKPSAPPADLDMAALPAVEVALADDPLVQTRHAEHAHRLRELELNRWAGIDADLVLAQNVSHGIHGPSTESTSIGVALSMPLDLAEARRARRNLARERAQKARLELQQAEEAFRRRANELQARLDIYQSDLVGTRRQLEAAYAAWEIALRRSRHLDGDVLEKALQACYALFQTAMQMSRSEESGAQTMIELAVLLGRPQAALTESAAAAPPTLAASLTTVSPAQATAGTAPREKPLGQLRFALALQQPPQDPPVDDLLVGFAADWHARSIAALAAPIAAVPAAAVSPARPALGWYVWEGERWLDSPASLPDLPSGSQRVSLSFRADTLQTLVTSQQAFLRARRLVAALHARGLQALWLVGDPHIVFADGRSRLLRWLPRMAAAGFDGLNLDAEPSQLDAPQQSQWLAALGETVSALRAAERLPVALTLHWRDALRADTAQALTAAGASEIEVMIYSTNDGRIAELARQIAAAWPRLALRVVQSIEPQLDSSESSAALGRGSSLERWRRLAQTLAAQANFRGIDVQSWETFLQARP